MALFITALFNTFMPRNALIGDLHLKVGQIAEQDIVAPYDFPLLKTDRQLEIEKVQIRKQLKSVYTLSSEPLFNSIKVINDIILPLASLSINADTTTVRKTFSQKGIILSDKSIKYLSNPNSCKSTYSNLMSIIKEIYQSGIYEEAIEDSFLLVKEDSFITAYNIEFYAKEKAIALSIAKYNQIDKHLLGEILSYIVEPNLVKDSEKFKQIEQKAMESVTEIQGTISKNEKIIRINSRITEEDMNKIQSLTKYKQKTQLTINTWDTLKVSISFFIYFFMLGMVFYAFTNLFYKQLILQKHHFTPFLIGLALNSILALINNQLLGFQTLLIPYSMFIITAAILVDVPFALFFNFIAFASLYPFVNWETFSPLIMVLGTTIVLLLMTQLSDKHRYITIWLYQTIITAILTVLFALYKSDRIMVALTNISYAFISSTLSVILMIFIVPFFERKWNLLTIQGLKELLDFNHPLLKRLAKEAIGTYYHSLIVGNLAEHAAETIGANALLTRVGSYYHDIGKVINPEYFTENNPASGDLHDALSPSASSEAIKRHVIDGIELVRKFNIPTSVEEIILQHHGTGYIRYFLDKAEKSRISIDLNQFKYNGPKPNSKEAALVMIADIVESTTKSIEDVFYEDIRKIINDAILRLIKDNQLDESGLTINDLSKIKECMLPILESIYRKRQQYPEVNNIEK